MDPSIGWIGLDWTGLNFVILDKNMNTGQCAYFPLKQKNDNFVHP